MVLLVVWYGKNTVCMWYSTSAVWYDGTVSWIYFMAKFAWWYGMFQYIRSVRAEYVVRISSVITLYIEHWKLSENISQADRQTDRQTDKFTITETETQFYKLRIATAIPHWFQAHVIEKMGAITEGVNH